MLVNELCIDEFRGIRKLPRPIRFSDFTVLIGRNNSGKSSVLEALSLLPYPTLVPSYSDKNRIDLLSSLHAGKSSLIYAYSGTAHLRYRFMKRRRLNITLKEKGDFTIEIPSMAKEIMPGDEFGQVIKLWGYPSVKAFWEKFRLEFSNKIVFMPNDTTFLDSLNTKLHEESCKNMVIKTGAHHRVAEELINPCVDDKYTEVLFTPEPSVRKELKEGPLYIRIKDLGDGIEKACLIPLWIEALMPDLVLWDDFEGSAHPTLIKRLLEWLSRKPWQVVLSTHSIDVLSCLVDVKPKNAKVVQLKKSREDVLIHKDMSLTVLENLLDANQDPRKLVDLLRL